MLARGRRLKGRYYAVSDDDLWTAWFDANRTVLETAYLRGRSPWQQSGFGLHSVRTERSWETLRRPVVDCLLDALPSSRSAQPIDFLDIGCANGYLLQCSVEWAATAGVTLVPWGLDLSDKLVALARQRLPSHADHLFCGNAWAWTPPRRFNALRTELVYVPEPLRQRYIERLLSEFLVEDGVLLAAEYIGRTPEGETRTLGIDATLRGWGYAVVAVRSGMLDGAERARIAAVRREGSR